MKALSIDQPYASLVAHGIKHWETRGQPLNGDMRPDGVLGLPGKRINAGERIAIAATIRKPPVVKAWDQGSIPPTVCPPTAWDVLPEWEQTSENEYRGGEFKWIGPLGAILCTVEVVGVLPIRSHLENPHLEGPNPALRDWSAWICHEVDIDRLTLDVDGCENVDISDQIPFGIWTPGRWAYELADVQLLPEPIPVKGKQGLWEWELSSD